MPRVPRERDYRVPRSFSRPYLDQINARAARDPPSNRNPRPTYVDANDREITRNVQQVARVNDPRNDDRTAYLLSLLRCYQMRHNGARVENRGNLFWIDVAATIEVIEFQDVMRDYVTQLFRLMEMEGIFEHGFMISVGMRVDTERQETGEITGLPFKSPRLEMEHPIGPRAGAGYVAMLAGYIEQWFQSRNQSFDLHRFGDVRISCVGLPARNINVRGGQNRRGNDGRRHIPNRFGDRQPIDIRPGYIGTHIATPKLLRSRNAIINPENKDNKCFLWASIISVKHHGIESCPGRLHHYRQYENTLFNMDGITYPFKIDHEVLRSLEKNNPDYGWNIMKWVDKDQLMFPIYRSKWNGTPDQHDKTFVNLIYFNNTDGVEDPSKWHFGAISDIKRLVKRCTASGSNNFCWTCGDVVSDLRWDKHVSFCKRQVGINDDFTEEKLVQDIEFMGENDRIAFGNDRKYLTGLMSQDVIIYADFECYTNTAEDDNIHTVCGYAFIVRVKIPIPELEHADGYAKMSQSDQLADIERRVRNFHFKSTKTPYKTLIIKVAHQQLSSENIAKNFINDIFGLRSYPEYRQYISVNAYQAKPPVPEEEYRFLRGDVGICETCNKCPGVKLSYYHDEKSGMLYGLICEQCKKTLSSRFEKSIPVVFQNGSKYDFHFIIKNLVLQDKEFERMSIVGDGEVFKTFTVRPFGMDKTALGGYKFLDSIRYLGPGSSLDNLMRSAKASNHTFPILREAYEMHTGKPMSEVMFDAFTRKGVFPYDWNTNITCLKHEGLPPKELFHSRLRSEHITDEDYEHAKKVWMHAGMKYFYEYHDLYMLVDTLQLCDFFETYRGNCWEQYGLEVLKFITGPSLFYAAALKHDGGELEYVQNEECQRMLESGLRGGMSMITHRFVELNENDDPGCIRYWDANNLYGWAMRQPLPVGKFERRTVSIHREYQTAEIRRLLDHDLEQWADPESPVSAFIEVDLKYPPELHDMHRDYPLAPYHLTPQWKNVSDYTKKFWSEPPARRRDGEDRTGETVPMADDEADIANWADNFAGEDDMYDDDDEVPVNKPVFSPSRKLCSTFWYHYNYVVHARNLKLYLDLGMKVTRIHSVMTFEQRPWLRDYIDMNTSKRILADQCGDGLKKDLFKLANNAVFGKMCENIRDFKQVKLFSDSDKALETVRSPLFQSMPVTIREESYEHAGDGLYSRSKLKDKLLFDKPIYVGVAILELSKLLMFDFHYNCVKEVFGDSCRLLMTDTDSLVYHFRNCKDPDRLLIERGYGRYLALQPDGSLSITPGLMKNEYHPKPGKQERLITGFVGLRAKTYALRFNDGKKDTMKAKAVPARSMELRNIRYKNYRAVLMSERPKAFRLNGIYSKAQTVRTVYDQKRIGLAASDDKRYILDNGIASVPYGYNPNRMVCDSDDDDYDDEVDRDE